MASPNQNPIITPKFRVGDIAYIHDLIDNYGRKTPVRVFYRIDGIGELDGNPILYNVTCLNSTPPNITRTLRITYLDSRATLKPAGAINSAGPNGGRKSFHHLKKRKSGKTRKLKKTRRNKRKRRI